MNSNNKKNRPWSEINLIEKIRRIKENITVEPMLAFYIVPSVLSGLATQNLYLDKACRVNLNYSDEICHALSQRLTTNYTLEETEVQKLVVAMQGWKTVLQSFLPALLILFWGSWSDRHQRRK
jgi:MFS transporter, PCFT/HCP family, solute carrier family 46, member 3